VAELRAALAAGAAAVRGRLPRPAPADAIVVPGAAVRPDGTASPALARRARAGAEAWRAGLAPRLVLTGGIVRHPPAEAVVAAAIARRLGVPEEALVLEIEARTTAENARRVAALGLGRRVIVVTDDFHAARCHLWFSRCFDHVALIAVRSPHRWRRLPRELASTAWAALRG
jgi:uncharacterized SAM-binding protein YcdF (DUF218 family)